MEQLSKPVSISDEPQPVTLEYLAEQQRQMLTDMRALRKSIAALRVIMLEQGDMQVALLAIHSLLSVKPSC